MENYEKYYNKGNDCDMCGNQYFTGMDGEVEFCKCKDEENLCCFVEVKCISN